MDFINRNCCKKLPDFFCNFHKSLKYGPDKPESANFLIEQRVKK